MFLIFGSVYIVVGLFSCAVHVSSYYYFFMLDGPMKNVEEAMKVMTK